MARPPDLHLTDPTAMRALAHPTRLRLLGSLRAEGPATVGMLSEAVDEAPGSVSYHLGKLAEHGFIVEAPELGRDRRERWWRAAHGRTTWSPLEMLDDPERRAASDSLRRIIWQRYAAQLEEYLETEASWPRPWVEAMASSDVNLLLTAAELAELRADLEAVTRRWEERSARGDRRGVEHVKLIYQAFPQRGRRKSS